MPPSSSNVGSVDAFRLSRNEAEYCIEFDELTSQSTGTIRPFPTCEVRGELNTSFGSIRFGPRTFPSKKSERL